MNPGIPRNQLIELAWWPASRPALPLRLERLERVGEAMLRARFPASVTGAAGQGALAAAGALLSWTGSRWLRDPDGRCPYPDANRILDRAAAGSRFGDAEYVLVLAQALNAAEIPARRLELIRDGGTCLVVEAWIDDLGKWVVLDPRDETIWRDGAGNPAGAVDLPDRYQAAAVPDGPAWSGERFRMVRPDGSVIRSSVLLNRDSEVAPDLSAISTGLTERGGPALTFSTMHPYATSITISEPGIEAARALAPERPFPLTGEPGDHRVTVAVTTRFGTLTPHHLHFVILPG